MSTFEVYGSLAWNGNRIYGPVSSIHLHSGYVATEAEAKEIAETFPKSYGVKYTHCHCLDNATRWFAFASANLSGNEVNEGKNETGLNRLRKILSRTPHTFVEGKYDNAASIEQLRALIG